jgi:protein-disulfide isomerase
MTPCHLAPWLCLLLPLAAAAQTPSCEALKPAQHQRAAALLASEHPYDCCDRTIAECLQQTPTCRLAVRLADAVCRQLEAGRDDATIRRSLSRRARSMLPGLGSEELVLGDAPCVGPDDARVTVVVFACARCQLCSEVVPELHAAVTDGPLAGTARLCFKPFPIRGHELSKEGGLAFVAAAAEDRFWPFALHLYTHFDEVSVDSLPGWADAVGLERFAELYAAEATREALVESKKQGLRLGVQATPAVFINSRHWVGDLGIEALVDAIQEEHERVMGQIYR